jgi:Phytanoyl-CoA dioxygenase (PhyH)
MTSEDSMTAHGFAFVRGVLKAKQCRDLIVMLGEVEGAGRRGLLSEPAVLSLANSATVCDLVRSHLPAEPIPVRGIYFDKSPGTNWIVTWHQDLTLTLRRRVEVPGFGPWSIKDGVPHVHPPVNLLEMMLTVRIHLDDCDESNGALRVLSGSHTYGRLSHEQIETLRGQQEEFTCIASAGDVLLMKPLLLHASGKSRAQSHRRVIHLEYAGFALPTPLEWHEAS